MSKVSGIACERVPSHTQPETIFSVLNHLLHEKANGSKGDGTLIEVYDRLGMQVDTSTPGLSFEAAWNEHGAVCLRKTRIPEIATFEDIEKECPKKLRGKTGEENCKESFDDPSVLILNRSPIALNP